MSDELDPKTLDIIGILTGRDYPELEVSIHLNEGLGLRLYQLDKELDAAEKRANEAEIKRLDEEKQKLLKSVESEKFVVTLQSIPEKARRDLVAKVEKEFPMKKDFLGNDQPNPAADELFTKLTWQAYVRKITGPDGASKLVDEKDIDALIANAPAYDQNAVLKGIQELQTGPQSGFEAAAKQVDFL